ncbi:hypothetical protein FN846DRAFT_894824 [Sphaerosporella brunnea]|uniref:Uncharacterized protein n=1 Tax=Sphaerosporella brunnea TaxID=1250544 RepID=A0A5J5EJ45_9PEZI|nr:hypothetical protein FN846DRAFT_894824 [Sphaerosporella brunnea]
MAPASTPTIPAQPSCRALPGTQTNTASGLELDVNVLGALPGTLIATNATPRLESDFSGLTGLGKTDLTWNLSSFPFEDGDFLKSQIWELEDEGGSELSDNDWIVASSSFSRASSYASSQARVFGDAVPPPDMEESFPGSIHEKKGEVDAKADVLQSHTALPTIEANERLDVAADDTIGDEVPRILHHGPTVNLGAIGKHDFHLELSSTPLQTVPGAWPTEKRLSNP